MTLKTLFFKVVLEFPLHKRINASKVMNHVTFATSKVTKTQNFESWLYLWPVRRLRN